MLRAGVIDMENTGGLALSFGNRLNALTLLHQMLAGG